jgi:cytochrome c553
MMKFAGLSLLGASVLVLSACEQQAPSNPPATAPREVTAQSPVERGKYLVSAIGGCDDCHTPKKMGPAGPEPDMTRRLSGHPESAKLSKPPAMTQGWMAATSGDLSAWAGPWGVSYAANLTPDQNTGLGIWTEEMFIRALREGKHMGQSRPILPPMPWQTFRNLSDEDLKAIFAFLRSLPAVTNHVPDPIINEAPAAAAPK